MELKCLWCLFQVANEVVEELHLKPEDVFLGQGE